MDAGHLYGELDWERRDKAKWIEKYHETDKRRAVLESQRDKSTAWGVILSFLLTLAGALTFQNFGWNAPTFSGIALFLIALIGSIQNLRK